MMMASCMENHLAEDLMIGVLSRLPVKSLLRFRCASKSWCAIITSRNFRYEHLNNNKAGSRLLAQFLIEDRNIPNLYAYFSDETLTDSSYHAFDTPNFDDAVDILHGPCNGIFMISICQQYYALWNPATKEYRELPNPGFPWHSYQESCGFGLDPITKDYKVVILRQIEHENLDIVGKVHTLGTEHWEDVTLDCAPVRYLHTSRCYSYLDGVYYFHARNSTALSFDMATNAMEVMPPPNELQPVNATNEARECFAVFQDKIALFHIQRGENYLSVWMLKEKSWTKHSTIGPLAEVQLPTGCWKNEILLLSCAQRLLLCKPTTQEIRNLGLQTSFWCSSIYAYKESLISIEDEYECKRQRDSEA